MKAILISALAATVSAEAIRVFARDIVEVRELMPRQSGASGLDSSQCAAAASSLLPLVSNVPTPPADLASAFASITDPCSLPTNLPASVLSEISSYESAILSFYSGHSAQIESALSACPAFTSYVSNAPVCSSGSGNSGSSKSSATATSSGSGTKQTGTSSSGSNSTTSGSGSTTSGTGSPISSAAKGVLSAGLAAGAFVVAVLAL